VLKKYACNMSNKDSYIRFAIATGLMFYGVTSGSFILGGIALVVFYTAYAKFCFIYYIFTINERFSKKNYYLSFLPQYNNSPIFIFDKNSKVVFANELAKSLFPMVKSIEDFHINNCAELIEMQKEENIMHKQGETYFQIKFRPVKEEGLMLAYFSDVSEVMRLNDEIEDTQREIIYAMGEIGETRSKETGNHVKRVALYSKKLALMYGLSYEEANILHMASPMHDIGKVGIPDAILNAPRKLDVEEFKVMQTHAELGYHMLKHSNKEILQAAAIVANEHHEKWDGSGYPNALKGENIHIYGRITALADVFDALASERVYKKAWELEKILELFKQESGKHFEPKLVTLFMDNLDEFLEIKEKYQDEI
jgi:response regulator RpfG family c-di-GMP phosphodiesterase